MARDSVPPPEKTHAKIATFPRSDKLPGGRRMWIAGPARHQGQVARCGSRPWTVRRGLSAAGNDTARATLDRRHILRRQEQSETEAWACRYLTAVQHPGRGDGDGAREPISIAPSCRGGRRSEPRHGPRFQKWHGRRRATGRQGHVRAQRDPWLQPRIGGSGIPGGYAANAVRDPSRRDWIHPVKIHDNGGERR